MRQRLAIVLLALGFAAPATALPFVTVSEHVLPVGEIVTLDLALDADGDFYAGFLLTFEATPSLELISFAPHDVGGMDASADLAAGVFSFARTLASDGSGRVALGRIEIRAGAPGADLHLLGRSVLLTPEGEERPFATGPLASTAGGGPASVLIPDPLIPPPTGSAYAGTGARAFPTVWSAPPPAIDLPPLLVGFSSDLGSAQTLFTPEPSSALLLAAGLAALVGGARRR